MKLAQDFCEKKNVKVDALMVLWIILNLSSPVSNIFQKEFFNVSILGIGSYSYNTKSNVDFYLCFICLKKHDIFLGKVSTLVF